MFNIYRYRYIHIYFEKIQKERRRRSQFVCLCACCVSATMSLCVSVGRVVVEWVSRKEFTGDLRENYRHPVCLAVAFRPPILKVVCSWCEFMAKSNLPPWERVGKGVWTVMPQNELAEMKSNTFVCHPNTDNLRNKNVSLYYCTKIHPKHPLLSCMSALCCNVYSAVI